MAGYAWVTLATNDAYSLGALVLAHSLRRVGTKYELAVLVTPGVTEMMREKLAAVFSLVQEVNVLDSKDEANLALLARPELGVTFTKLHAWRLTQYEKCVFVDADTLVVRNCDELFEREELSAAPDVGWPDCFNSGVFVFRPSLETFASITAFAAAKGSFDGGDQGLLNMYFNDWARKDISKHLPFIYNMCSTATYSYLPAFKQFGEDVRIIHFIGITKPWLQYFDTLTGIVQPPSGSVHLQPLLQLWWNIFCEKVHPQLSPVMAGLAGALAQMTLGEPRSAEQIALEEHMRKQSWEQGQIDYMGRDSFDNIWKKICETLSLAPQRSPSPPKETSKADKTTTGETVESVESVKDKEDKPIAEATTGLTEEQSSINDVHVDKTLVQVCATNDTIPTKDNENFPPKLAETTEQTTSAEQDAKQVVAATGEMETEMKKLTIATSIEEKTKEDSCPKTLTETGIETIPDTDSSAKLPIQSAEVVTELLTSSLPEEQLTQQTITAESCEVKPPSSTETSKDQRPPESVSASDIKDVSTAVAETVKNVECAVKLPTVEASESSTVKAALPEEESTKVVESGTVLVCQAPAESLQKPEVPVGTQLAETEPSIKTEQHAEMFSAASEVLSVSPVPIQVAESVLQAEPEESISDSPVASQQVLSSTVTPVHESTAMPLESLREVESKIQLNGTASEIAAVQETAKAQMDAAEAVCAPVVPPARPIEIPTPSPTAEQPEKELEKACALPLTAERESVSLDEKSVEQSPEAVEESKESIAEKPLESATDAPKPEPQTTPPSLEQSTEQVEEAENGRKNVEADLPKSEPSATPLSIESPIRPSRAKEVLNIPPTPTVTEATPPTSPPISVPQELEGQEKITKKVLKKVGEKSSPESDPPEATDGDSAEKKTAKKVVKKVVKKTKSKSEEAPDDGAECSGSPSKQKKTVKVVKKGTKPSQTLGADVPAPETPPPGSTETPIPPKRKVKATTAKTATAKKSDVE